MSDRFQWNFRFEILFAADHASGPKEKYITKKQDRGEEVKALSKTKIESKNQNESARTKKRREMSVSYIGQRTRTRFSTTNKVTTELFESPSARHEERYLACGPVP
jgi:hypothetical protein